MNPLIYPAAPRILSGAVSTLIALSFTIEIIPDEFEIAETRLFFFEIG